MENISYMFHMFCFLCFSVNRDRVLCQRQTHRQNTQNHTHSHPREQTDAKDSILQAGTHSDSHNRQAEGGHEAENSKSGLAHG